MFSHFLHDEWITDQKTDYPRRIEPRLLTENCTVIEFHEHHEPRLPESSSHSIFQFSEGPCTFGRLSKLRHIRMADRSFERLQDRLERLGTNQGEPFHLDSSGSHDFPFFHSICPRRTRTRFPPGHQEL